MAVAVAAGALTPQGSFPAGVAGEVGDVVALDDTGWRGASSEVSSSNSRFLICSMPCGTHAHRKKNGGNDADRWNHVAGFSLSQEINENGTKGQVEQLEQLPSLEAASCAMVMGYIYMYMHQIVELGLMVMTL